MEGLAFALLDVSAAIPDAALAARLRDLTISWSRFKYAGPILEGTDLEDLLARAAAGGHRYCPPRISAWHPPPRIFHGLRQHVRRSRYDGAPRAQNGVPERGAR